MSGSNPHVSDQSISMADRIHAENMRLANTNFEKALYAAQSGRPLIGACGGLIWAERQNNGIWKAKTESSVWKEKSQRHRDEYRAKEELAETLRVDRQHCFRCGSRDVRLCGHGRP